MAASSGAGPEKRFEWRGVAAGLSTIGAGAASRGMSVVAMPAWQALTLPDAAPAQNPTRRYIVCFGEIVFATAHFVGFVPPGRSLNQPLAVPRSAIDPNFPKPGPDLSLSDYGLAIDEAWVRQHLVCERPSEEHRRGRAFRALGALAAVALIWWTLA